MNKEAFNQQKENLAKLIHLYLANTDISEPYRADLLAVLDILNKYSPENSLSKKGLLSHTIIDSLVLESSLAEKLINFDNSIN